MILTDKKQLVALRRELGLSQQRLHELSGVGRRTIVTIESEDGYAQINYTTAKALLDALNEARKERNMPVLGLYDVDWKIRG